MPWIRKRVADWYEARHAQDFAEITELHEALVEELGPRGWDVAKRAAMKARIWHKEDVKNDVE